MSEEQPKGTEPTEPTYKDPLSPESDLDEKTLASYRRMALNMLAAPNDVLLKFFESLGNTEQQSYRVEWSQAITKANAHLFDGDVFSDTFASDERDFQQDIRYEGAGLNPGRLGGNHKEGDKISGDAAVRLAMHSAGVGDRLSFPLYSSGFWINISAPPTTEELVLERQISSDKITLGRETNGMAYSNVMTYALHYLVSFIFNHVENATIKGVSPERLREMTLITDLQPLIGAVLQTIYPNGQPYAVPCINMECQHVQRGKVNFVRMRQTDRASLTQEQLRFMANRGSKVDDEEILKYREQHSRGQRREVAITDTITMVLGVPTIAEAERSGFSWVDGLVSAMERTLGQQLVGDQRNTYLLQQAKLTNLCAYAHWVKEIHIGGVVCDDPATIEKQLKALSGMGENFQETFYTAIKKYIEDSTLTILGVPEHTCPKCGTKHSGSESFSPRWVPVDMFAAFFTQLVPHIEENLHHR